MCVHLRCRRACVTQQSPNTIYTCAIIEHCRGERVSQHVRRELFLRADERQLGFYPGPNVIGLHTVAFYRDEQRVTLTAHLLVPTRYVAPKRHGEFFSEWHHPLLVTLSGYFQLAVITIYVHIVEPRQLRQAYARLVEGHYYRLVPNLHEACAPWQVIEQAIHLAFLDKRRQSLALFRRLYPIGWVALHKVAYQGVTIKRPKGREACSHARCFHTTIHEMFHPITDDILIDCLPAEPTVKTTEVILKFPE